LPVAVTNVEVNCIPHYTELKQRSVFKRFALKVYTTFATDVYNRTGFSSFSAVTVAVAVALAAAAAQPLLLL